ncbi:MULTISPECIES: mannonate dehydratase [unclassified Sphingomonas]|uniref:mannonate dehydratase n=1 Tax=unclassified Sphingomonas TaxID=196159 RepID=UPI0026B5AF22
MIKLTMLIPPAVDRRWPLASQMGIRHVIAKLAPELTGKLPPWDYDSLRSEVDRYAEGGFRIAGMEGDQFDMTRIKLGQPGRDDDIELYKRMLQNMGRCGIDLLCYNFMPLGWLRNRLNIADRGGATTTGYTHADEGELDTPVTLDADALWDNYNYFIQRVIPAAEDAGVRMAMHPDDPPAPMIRGIARIFINADASQRALDLVDSPMHGLTFCQATYKTMGEDVEALVRRFGAQNKIFYVHIRDVKGIWTDFVETFPESGDTDMAAMVRAYRDIGFDGYLRPDHAPSMVGAPTPQSFEGGVSVGYEPEGMVYTIGYIKGLMQATGLQWC